MVEIAQKTVNHRPLDLLHRRVAMGPVAYHKGLSMYIWNTKALALNFAKGDLPTKIIIKYLIYIMVLQTFSDGIYTPRPQSYFIHGVTLVLDVSAIFWLYFANKRVDGKQFLDRCVAFIDANMLRYLALCVITLGLCFIPIKLGYTHDPMNLSLYFCNFVSWAGLVCFVRRDILRIKELHKNT